MAIAVAIILPTTAVVKTHRQAAKSAPPVLTLHKETSVKSNEKSSVSYADTLKSSGASTNTSENSVGFETCFQTLTQNLTTFTQNMTNIMTSMQNTMQELLRSQNQMLQILLSKK